jgi:mono/diheme cytochrome c family protein
MRHALLLLALVAAPLAASAAIHPLAFDQAADRGQGVAQRRCVECHAVRPGRDSADGDAPPFTVLRLRYNELSLAKRIGSVTHGEHAGMPPTFISDADLHDLVAYIESLGSDSP